MTLVVGMQTQDGLLLGADSLVEEEQTQLHDWRKVQAVDGAPIAWGWSGDLPERDLISKAISDATTSNERWPDVAHKIAQVVAQDTGRRVLRAKLAALGFDLSKDATGILIAGWLTNAGPAIVDIHPAGNVTFAQPHDGFLSIGSARHVARIIFETLRRRQPTRDESLFREVIGLAVKLSPHCGFPVHIYRVAQTGLTELSPIEIGPD